MYPGQPYPQPAAVAGRSRGPLIAIAVLSLLLVAALIALVLEWTSGDQNSPGAGEASAADQACEIVERMPEDIAADIESSESLQTNHSLWAISAVNSLAHLAEARDGDSSLVEVADEVYQSYVKYDMDALEQSVAKLRSTCAGRG